jgi:hypothetical protein
MGEGEVMARSQHLLALDGKAVNQCPSCGVYRTDGEPPVLHRADCTIAEHDGGSFRWRDEPHPPTKF